MGLSHLHIICSCLGRLGTELRTLVTTDGHPPLSIVPGSCCLLARVPCDILWPHRCLLQASSWWLDCGLQRESQEAPCLDVAEPLGLTL